LTKTLTHPVEVNSTLWSSKGSALISPEARARESARWAVGIAIRDANALDGLGQDQCRKRERILDATTLRLVMAAARTLWFMAHVDGGTGVPLYPYRPWYRQEAAPSQLDVAEVCREASIRPTFSHTTGYDLFHHR